MSSRNRFLEPEIRKEADIIYSSLQAAAIMMMLMDIPDIKEWIKRNIEETEGFSLEYFEIVDDRELIPLESKKDIVPGKRYFGCIAVKAGPIRLIDNLEIPLF
jgi:pantothenate synthetase